MITAQQLPATSRRVEENTRPEVNEEIRQRDNGVIARYEGAQPNEITARVSELNREWDVERWLQLNSSVLVLAGVALGFRVNPRFFLLPAAVYSFFLQHSLQGWCPPLPIMRRMGIRTVREIERERYALKALRGDFDQLPSLRTGSAATRVDAVLSAIDT